MKKFVGREFEFGRQWFHSTWQGVRAGEHPKGYDFNCAFLYKAMRISSDDHFKQYQMHACLAIFQLLILNMLNNLQELYM
jgi:hypothetical protein